MVVATLKYLAIIQGIIALDHLPLLTMWSLHMLFALSSQIENFSF